MYVCIFINDRTTGLKFATHHIPSIVSTWAVPTHLYKLVQTLVNIPQLVLLINKMCIKITEKKGEITQFC